MSLPPVSATPSAARTAAPQPVGPATPPDVRAMSDAFAAAAKRGHLPLGETGKATPKGPPGERGPLARAPVGMPPNRAAMDEALRRAGIDAREQNDQAALGLMGQGGPPVAPATPAALPTAHVDPSVFADMLTQMWLREKDRSTREVRVSFGDAAWPATGARLTRLEDGSLSVAVSVGDRGATVSGGLAALRERLEGRGLTIADVSVEAA